MRKPGGNAGLFATRHCERSEAIQIDFQQAKTGLLRRYRSSQ
jgi:hypothetical protein